MNPWAEIPDPTRGNQPSGDPVKGMLILMAKLAGLDGRWKIDRELAEAWHLVLGGFSPELVTRAVIAYYDNPDTSKFQCVSAGWVRSWCRRGAPSFTPCPEHPWLPAGPCGECRAERLIAGTEKPLGVSTVPQLSGRDVPMPEHLKHLQIGARP